MKWKDIKKKINDIVPEEIDVDYIDICMINEDDGFEVKIRDLKNGSIAIEN